MDYLLSLNDKYSFKAPSEQNLAILEAAADKE
jgi:hypothetical protein